MDVFDLMATIDLDSTNYEKGLNDAESRGQSSGSKIGKALSTAGKVAAVGIGAAATAVGFMTKAAVSGFAEQQQLVGGVQKLYGNMGMSVEEYAASVGQSVEEASGKWQELETAQNMVLDNAKNAYKTAGMSANQYMETATSFSAALINSLGGDSVKAAEQTDVAMRAISDNFNTFGGDIGMIQGAFQGFAKQNYTMLDNLKLGYGGTKSEMERLIADANAYGEATGQASNLTIDSFSDIVTAIDLVQQKQQIAGTTAREAASTVEGSLNMLKGAWTNLLAGLGDADADIDSLVDNVVDSAGTVIENILPVVEQALSGIGDLIGKIAPLISEKLPELMENILPPLISAATSLITGLVSALPTILQVLIQALPGIIATLLPALIEAGVQLVVGLVTAMPTIIQALIQAIPTIIQSIVSMDWAGYATQIVQAFITGFTSIASMLGVTGNMTMEQILNSITSKLGQMLTKGAEIVSKIATGILNAAPQAITSILNLVTRLVQYLMQNLPQFLAKGAELVGKIASGIIQGLPGVMNALGSGLGKLITTIAQNLPEFLQKGIELVGKIAAGIIRAIPQIISAIIGGIGKMKEQFSSVDWGQIGRNILSGIANGIRNGLSSAISAASDVAQSILGKFKSMLKIGSPSKVFRDQVGKMIGAGMALGIEQSIPLVDSAIGDLEDVIPTDIGGLDFGPDEVVTTIKSDDGSQRAAKNVTHNWIFNVDGSENPEQFANRVLRRVKMVERMAY